MRYDKNKLMIQRFLWKFIILMPLRINAKAIDLWGATSTQLKEHKPNYCNNTELIAKAGLLRSPLGQFLGFPCSNEFFHCRWQSDGYRTYLKNCRTGKNNQIFFNKN